MKPESGFMKGAETSADELLKSSKSSLFDV